MVNFTIPGEPRGKARPRWGNGRTYTPRKTVEYEKRVKSCFLSAGGKLLDGEIRAELRAYYGIPKSASKRARADMLCGKTRPTKKPDLDNVAKIVLDSLNGLAYKDDAAVVELTAEKHYSETPRVEVRMEAKECGI